MRLIALTSLCFALLAPRGSQAQVPTPGLTAPRPAPHRVASPAPHPGSIRASPPGALATALSPPRLGPSALPSPSIAPATALPPPPVGPPPVGPPPVGPPPVGPPREDARGARRRDPCEETLRAVDFEDHPRAEEAWPRCRASLATQTPSAEELSRMELVASALSSLRRTDGAFCVAPAAPFDLDPWLGGVSDARQCLVALERFLSSESELRRWMLAEPYAAGRLSQRAGVVIDPARPVWPLGARVESESVSLARLAGRRFMRVCRCLPGPQPEGEASVRAMHLPRGVERVLLSGISDRRTPPR